MTTLDLGPSDHYTQHTDNARILLLACGALAREIVDLIEINTWQVFDIQCLPAKWHNTPQFIVPALRAKIRENKANYKSIFVLYGDCGTGGYRFCRRFNGRSELRHGARDGIQLDHPARYGDGQRGKRVRFAVQ